MVNIIEIKTLIADQLGISEVSENDRIVEDLGAESADIANIVAAVEDKYDIEVSEDKLEGLVTVRDVYVAIMNIR
jgi:acyl carrier protein